MSYPEIEQKKYNWPNCFYLGVVKFVLFDSEELQIHLVVQYYAAAAERLPENFYWNVDLVITGVNVSLSHDRSPL